MVNVNGKNNAGGARAKALIAWNEATNEVRAGQMQLGSGFDYWLMKFDNVAKNGDHGLEDKPEYTLIEYAYYLMDRSGKWALSPAYDITFSYNPENKWLCAHQMTINGKTNGKCLD